MLRHTGISAHAAWALSASGQGGWTRGQESPVSRGGPALKKWGESGLRNLAAVFTKKSFLSIAEDPADGLLMKRM